jgi:hypothetical protein
MILSIIFAKFPFGLSCSFLGKVTTLGWRGVSFFGWSLRSYSLWKLIRVPIYFRMWRSYVYYKELPKWMNINVYFPFPCYLPQLLQLELLQLYNSSDYNSNNQ